MKTKHLLLAFFFCLTNVLQSWAYDFEVDGIYYNYIQGTDNEVEVTHRYAAGTRFYSGDIIIPSAVIHSGISYKVTRIGNNAFSNSVDLTSIDIPESVTTIGNNAFSTCWGLTSIDLPNSINIIEYEAFNSCVVFTTIVIPGSVIEIGESVFRDCYNLTTIVVDSGNQYYSSENGVLFDKTQTRLIYFPMRNWENGGHYSVPENIKYIESQSFNSCYLISVTIPESVIEIGNNAFKGCTNLKKMEIKKDIPIEIDESSFNDIAFSCILIVPKGTQMSYINANGWKNFRIIVNDSYVGTYENVISFTPTQSRIKDIPIRSNTGWSISNDADWITIVPESGEGDGILTISVSANYGLIPRSSEIIISGENAEDWIVQVSQQIDYSPGWEYIRSIGYEWERDWMNKVYTQGNNTVYVVGDNGFIAKSADCALTWDKQYFPTQEKLNDIIFCNDELGFIVGNNGIILKTEDAGYNWTQLNSGTTQHINAIAAANENNIWIVGNGGLIMQSTDRGETWASKSDGNYRNLYDIKFHKNTGYIIGDGNNILKTNDGGVSWDTQIAYNNPGVYDNLYSLSITENKAFALLNRGAIISAAHDSNWSFIDDQRDSRTGIYFQNENCGYAASAAYTTCWCGFGLWINQTTDGGKTWEEISIPNLPYNVGIADNSNFSFSEDNKFGYFLSGQVLLRTPYTGDFYVGLNEVKPENSRLTVKQQENEFQINSLSKTIASVEIISVTGVKLFQENKQANEVIVNVNNFPKGIYLTRVQFTDKTNETVKWIKH